MRKHATWYTRGITHGAVLRDKFNKAVSRQDFVDILQDYFDTAEPVSEPTAESMIRTQQNE